MIQVVTSGFVVLAVLGDEIEFLAVELIDELFQRAQVSLHVGPLLVDLVQEEIIEFRHKQLLLIQLGVLVHQVLDLSLQFLQLPLFGIVVLSDGHQVVVFRLFDLLNGLIENGLFEGVVRGGVVRIGDLFVDQLPVFHLVLILDFIVLVLIRRGNYLLEIGHNILVFERNHLLSFLECFELVE